MLTLAETLPIAARYADQDKHARLDGDRLSYTRAPNRGWRAVGMVTSVALILGWTYGTITLTLAARDRGEDYLAGVVMLGLGVPMFAVMITLWFGYYYLDLATGNIYRHQAWGDRLRMNAYAIEGVNMVPSGYREQTFLTAEGMLDGRRVRRRIGIFRNPRDARSFSELLFAMRAGR